MGRESLERNQSSVDNAETPSAFEYSVTVRILELISLNITFLVFVSFVYMQHSYDDVSHKPFMFMWISYSVTNMVVIVDLLSRLMNRRIDTLPWLMFCGMCSGMHVLTSALFGMMAAKLERDSYVVMTSFGCAVTGLAFLVDWTNSMWKVGSLKKALIQPSAEGVDVPSATYTSAAGGDGGEVTRAKNKPSRTSRPGGGGGGSKASIANSRATRSTTFLMAAHKRRSVTGTCARHESLARLCFAKSHPEGNVGKKTLRAEAALCAAYGHDPPPPKKPRIPDGGGCCLTSWSQLDSVSSANGRSAAATAENGVGAGGGEGGGEHMTNDNDDGLQSVKEYWRKPQAQWAQCIQPQEPSRIGYLVPLAPGRRVPSPLSGPAAIQQQGQPGTGAKSPPSTPGSLGPAPPKKPKWSAKLLGVTTV